MYKMYGRKKLCATLKSVTKQEQLCLALGMVEDIFWHEVPCREWAGHKQGKKWLLFVSNWEQIQAIWQCSFFSHFQQLKEIEMETVDMLTKFMSTQRQAMTYTT